MRRNIIDYRSPCRCAELPNEGSSAVDQLEQVGESVYRSEPLVPRRMQIPAMFSQLALSISILVLQFGTLLITGCTANKTDTLTTSAAPDYSLESKWMIASGFERCAADRCEWIVLDGEPEAGSVYQHALDTSNIAIRKLFGGPPVSLARTGLDLSDELGTDRKTLCELVRSKTSAEFLAIIFVAQRERFRFFDTEGELRVRVEVWKLTDGTPEFAATSSSVRRHPIPWVSVYENLDATANERCKKDVDGMVAGIAKDMCDRFALSASHDAARTTTTSN